MIAPDATARPRVVIVGAGPAGLFAAERLAAAGAAVTLCDRMAAPARKFLLAGRGGLNLTHSEPREAFLPRYRQATAWLQPMLDAFPPPALRAWAEGLGEPTFVGSSERVFPRSFKASPLLRAWLARLRERGVTFRPRHQWLGFGPGRTLVFETPHGRDALPYDAALLALGGASWPRLGSDGGWTDLLAAQGVAIAPLVPATMGIQCDWTADFAARFAGEPLKPVALTAGGETALGEAVITERGLEGGVVYALSPGLRTAAETGRPVALDLKPGMTPAALGQRLAGARPKDSLTTVLRKRIGLAPQAIGLLREAGPLPRDASHLVQRIKAMPLLVRAIAPMARAISSAGGIRRDALTDGLELTALSGVFAAGEMLDWEAPTGGYLLQASFATAAAAARAMAAKLGLDAGAPGTEPGDWMHR